MVFKVTKEPIYRFLDYVVPDDVTGCWLWYGGRCSPGKKGLRAPYGKFWLNGKTVIAHRFAYEYFVGPIPEHLQLDHECEVHYCVNPDHLTPKTPGANTLSSAHAPATINKAKTRCPQRHRYTTKNTYITARGQRQCRRCNRDKMRARRASSQ